MTANFKNAVERWLNAIIPSVAATIPDLLTQDVLAECAKENCIHGPYSINFDKFGGPITAVNFYVMVAEKNMVLAVTASIRDNEAFIPEINFDMVFQVDEFAEKIQEKDSISTIISNLLKQIGYGYVEV